MPAGIYGDSSAMMLPALDPASFRHSKAQEFVACFPCEDPIDAAIEYLTQVAHAGGSSAGRKRSRVVDDPMGMYGGMGMYPMYGDMNNMSMMMGSMGSGGKGKGGNVNGMAPRPGDNGNWKCMQASCGNVNFRHRTKCNKCGVEKPEGADGQ